MSAQPTPPSTPTQPTPKRTPRAGRDLPAAIGVGVVLGALVVIGMFFVPPVIVAVAAAGAGVGTWEVTRALNLRPGLQVPLAPAVVTGALFPVAAYLGGGEALLYSVLAAVIVVVLWRMAGPREGMLPSIMAAVFTMSWVPFMLALAVVLFRGEDGPARVFTIVVMAIGNDTWGYLAGVLWGKHPMAPRISPKKTWEGFAGSMVGSVAVGILCAVLLLHDPWWHGAVLAVLLVIASTVGDLSESMVKREVGTKDMSHILPGHGGVMDRLDSIVFAAAIGYVVFAALS